MFQSANQQCGDKQAVIRHCGWSKEQGVLEAYVLKPQVRPEVDLSKVDLGVGNVGGEVLPSDAGVSVAGVVLHIGVILAPEAFVANGDQMVSVHCLCVVGHYLDPGLQHTQQDFSTQALQAAWGHNTNIEHVSC